MNLTDFLDERITEDEDAAVGEVLSLVLGGVQPLAGTPLAFQKYSWRFSPHRALKEAEAKRAVIEDAWVKEVAIEGEYGAGRGRDQLEDAGVYPDALRFLADVYSEHPHYDEAWRPTGG